MNNLTQSAMRAVEEYKMLDKGDNVIVALSGGADSVSLLHFMLSIREQYSLTIMAAHVNHNLRGKESDSDETFVKQLCSKYDVKLFVKSVDINKIAKRQKISTELCGRNQRYNFFKELSSEYSAKIATAHTASDNTETILFNLTRGSGLKGITGIQPVRDYIVRPLIYTSRSQVESYCEDNELIFVTDSSNLGDEYTRNKIRHNVIPCLAEINPEVDNTFLRTSKLLNDFNDYFTDQVETAMSTVKTDNGYNAELIDKLHPALKNSVLYSICKSAGADVEYRHIQLLCNCLSGGAVDLPNSKRGIIKQNTLRIVNTDETISEKDEIEINFKKDSYFSFYNKTYKTIFEETNNSRQYLAPSLLEKNLFFRTRRQGDIFTLPYRNVTKTVKKLFNELKIPAEKRDKLLVLTDGKVVYWIEGVGPSKQGLSTNIYGVKISVDT